MNTPEQTHDKNYIEALLTKNALAKTLGWSENAVVMKATTHSAQPGHIWNREVRHIATSGRSARYSTYRTEMVLDGEVITARQAFEYATTKFLATLAANTDSPWAHEGLVKAITRYNEAVTAYNAGCATVAEFEANYTGWTRYSLCTSSAHGHVHTGWECSTLRPTSTLALLWQLSGLTETEMIGKMEAGACTRCFPNAPLDRTGKLGVKAQKALAALLGSGFDSATTRPE